MQIKYNDAPADVRPRCGLPRLSLIVSPMEKSDIQHHSLTEFIPIAESMGIDFPQYAYVCGATKFIEHIRELNQNSWEFVPHYRFKEEYIESGIFSHLPLYVLWLPNISYLLYDKYSEISIWVCYTEETHRKKGHMRTLLEELKKMYEGRKIVIDTYNPTLRRYSEEVGFELFSK